MELIAFASGKGGTGKTLMASCLGYSLLRAGHRVLMIDADPATDGLSLFLLGPRGVGQTSDFSEMSTFTGILQIFQSSESSTIEPRRINRAGSDREGDHGVAYDAIISGRGLYGDHVAQRLALPDLDQKTFRDALARLFVSLRATDQYDYVIVDTRGGFAFESTDVCALADSFIVVTDPDITSFYQDRNLVKRISAAADEMGLKPLLRSFIVNRATEGYQPGDQINLDQLEVSFRLQLEREFPIKFKDTHPVPADIEVLLAYKTQRVPYLAAPASLFSFATLSAFGEILKIVTAKWSDQQVQRWNELVASISGAIDKRNKQILTDRESQVAAERQVSLLSHENMQLREKVAGLEDKIQRLDEQYSRDISRADALFSLKRRGWVVACISLLALFSATCVGGAYAWKKWQARAAIQVQALVNAKAELAKLQNDGQQAALAAMQEYQFHLNERGKEVSLAPNVKVTFYPSDGSILVTRKSTGFYGGVESQWVLSPERVPKASPPDVVPQAPIGLYPSASPARLGTGSDPIRKRLLPLGFPLRSISLHASMGLDLNEPGGHLLRTQAGCLNPHPGPFASSWGAPNGCWVPLFRRWRDACSHYQWYNSCSGYWDSGIHWTYCVASNHF